MRASPSIKAPMSPRSEPARASRRAGHGQPLPRETDCQPPRRRHGGWAGPGLAVFILLLPCGSARAAAAGSSWSQFRGPNGQGAAATSHLPSRFGPETNVAWQTAVPPGHSSPVLWGSRLFLTAYDPADAKELTVLAVDRDQGGILWRRTVAAARPAALHQLNTPASSTPVADDQHLYVYFGTLGLLCYDHAGREVWRRPLPSPPSKYGTASSPILDGGHVILVLDGDDGSSRLLALQRDTGATAWEQPRSLFKAGWSTPMLFHHDGGRELIVLGAKRLTAYDPTTGQERWWVGGFPPETVGVPVEGDGLLFASAAALGGRGDDQLDAAATWKTTLAQFDRNHDNQIERDEMTKGFAFIQRPELPPDNPGYGLPVHNMDTLLRLFDHDKNGVITEKEWMETMASFAAASHPTLMALRPGATGDARPSHLAWEIRRGVPEVASLLYAQHRLYLLRDGGLLSCLETTTGRELFRDRVGAPGQYIASPVLAGDKVVVASVPGVVTVLEAGDQLKVLAHNEFHEGIFATPALAGNRLYLRTAGHLYALGE